MSTNRTPTIIAALCLGFASATLAQQSQDELKQRLLVQAQSISPDDYAFTRTVRTEQTSAGKTEKKITVEKFDPTKPAEKRWTLASIDGAPPSDGALKAFRADAVTRRIPGYARLAGYFEAPARASTDSQGRTVFHFAALPKDTVKLMGTDVSQNTTADAIVSEANAGPFVEELHLTVKAMRLKLIVKLEGYESISRYRIGPEGKPLLLEQTFDMSGSGMGIEGRAHTVTTYSDYRAVGGK